MRGRLVVSEMWWAGFDFPRGPRAYAPRFCCGPLDFFSLGAQNSMKIKQKSCFWPLIFIERHFRAPSLKSKCQTLPLAILLTSVVWIYNTFENIFWIIFLHDRTPDCHSVSWAWMRIQVLDLTTGQRIGISGRTSTRKLELLVAGASDPSARVQNFDRSEITSWQYFCINKCLRYMCGLATAKPPQFPPDFIK